MLESFHKKGVPRLTEHDDVIWARWLN